MTSEHGNAQKLKHFLVKSRDRPDRCLNLSSDSFKLAYEAVHFPVGFLNAR